MSTFTEAQISKRMKIIEKLNARTLHKTQSTEEYYNENGENLYIEPNTQEDSLQDRQKPLSTINNFADEENGLILERKRAKTPNFPQNKYIAAEKKYEIKESFLIPKLGIWREEQFFERGVSSSSIQFQRMESERKTPEKSASLIDNRSKTSKSLTDSLSTVKGLKGSLVSSASLTDRNRSMSVRKSGRKLMVDVYGREMEIPQARKSIEITEKIKNDIKERKKLTDHFLLQGAQKYENKQLKKEMELQMKQLENRIKRLEVEQKKTEKELKKTENQTKLTLETKKRHQIDLTNIRNEKLQKKRAEEEMREAIKQRKTEQDQSLKLSLALNKAKISSAASEIQRIKIKKLEERNKWVEFEHEKKLDIHEKTHILEKNLKEQKFKSDQMNKNKADEKHHEFLKEYEKQTGDIDEKIKEMSRVEEALIEKIRVTQQLKTSAQDKMKKLLLTKVTADSSFDLN